MLSKFISTVSRVGRGSDFDIYVKNLNRNGISGGPTADEAKRDYRNAIRYTTNLG